MTSGLSPRLSTRSLFGCVLFAIVVLPAADVRSQPVLNSAIANRFRITTFATGLNFPTSMQQLSDGSILVGTSDPVTGSIYNSTGTLLRFTDTNRDGVADGPGQVVATGLTGTVSSIRQAGDLLFVTSSRPGQEKITVMRMGSTPSDSLTSLGSINFQFPSGSLHTTYALAVRESPTQPGSFELFFNVGSRTNNTRTTTPIPVTGLITADLNGDSIYRVTVTDPGAGAPASRASSRSPPASATPPASPSTRPTATSTSRTTASTAWSTRTRPTAPTS